MTTDDIRCVKKIISILLVIGIILSIFSATLAIGKKSFVMSSDDDILYVGGDGPQNYSKIQDAVDNASDGYTIFVYNGTYYENVLVNKTVNLVGENRETTIIDGSDGDYVVFIIADGVTLTGFTIQNSHINGTNIDASDSSIINNIFRENGYLGISLKNSDKAIISDNLIINNERGLCLCHTNENTEIFCNSIEDNHYCGIYIYRSCNNNAYKNDIMNNQCGIIISRADNNTISNNYIYCEKCNVRLYLSSNNKIASNNFIKNNICAFFSCCNNIWDGNYWIRPRVLPKPIFGTRGEIGIIPWVNFDRHPAQRPCETA